MIGTVPVFVMVSLTNPESLGHVPSNVSVKLALHAPPPPPAPTTGEEETVGVLVVGGVVGLCVALGAVVAAPVWGADTVGFLAADVEGVDAELDVGAEVDADVGVDLELGVGAEVETGTVVAGVAVEPVECMNTYS